MKVLKWVVGGFVLLIVIGAIAGGSEQEDRESGSKDSAAQIAETTEEPAESTPEPEPTQEPKPELEVDITSPRLVHSDDVTLRGSVSLAGAKVRVKGQEGRAVAARVNGRRWAADVEIMGLGNNEYTVVAVKKGAVTGREEHTIRRERSAAERAVIRQQRAERRANERALASAESYLEFSGFSKQGLYEQLSSEYGEGFTPEQAQYAVDHVDANWNQEAVESARSYLEHSPMSRDGLIEQLTSEYGEGFTYEQALYAVNKVY
jgi:Host cell surface-exposed lipoprotein